MSMAFFASSGQELHDPAALGPVPCLSMITSASDLPDLLEVILSAVHLVR